MVIIHRQVKQWPSLFAGLKPDVQCIEQRFFFQLDFVLSGLGSICLYSRHFGGFEEDHWPLSSAADLFLAEGAGGAQLELAALPRTDLSFSYPQFPMPVIACWMRIKTFIKGLLLQQAPLGSMSLLTDLFCFDARANEIAARGAFGIQAGIYPREANGALSSTLALPGVPYPLGSLASSPAAIVNNVVAQPFFRVQSAWRKRQSSVASQQ